MGLVRDGKRKVRGSGFLVTWDIDSRDQTAVNRTQYFLFGRRVRTGGKDYAYSGFVWKEGVRYVAQSALFVVTHRLAELRLFLSGNGIDHDVDSMTYL
jgi:hypothetical protein